jgi:hypothetical protein
MLPLYATRIEDLGSGDFVKVDCAACHHVALLTPEALLRQGLRPVAKILDLKGASGAAGAGGRGGRSLRSSGGGRPCEASQVSMSPQRPCVPQRKQLSHRGRVEPD